MAKGKKEDTKKLLERIRARYKVMTDADDENRRAAMIDLKFANVPGEQWDAVTKRERGERPCWEFNKTRITCKRIINDIRANRPSGKARATEGGDKETAEIYEGLIRNIWNCSDGDTIMDAAAEYQVPAGYGAWRIVTKYSSDTAFDQDIAVEGIHNPFCVYSDPAAKDMMKRDAQDWIVTERISKKAYEKRWPKAEVVDFEAGEFDNNDEWEGDDQVRICEYWWKEPTEKEIIQTIDGKVVDAASDEAPLLPPEQIKRRRTVVCDKVRMCIASGNAILEGPTDWAGTMFPFVPVYGEYIIVDGKVIWFGVVRFAKDAQRSYNVARTAVTEKIALNPNAKFWTTPKQAIGNEAAWKEAHKKNIPFLVYNPDEKAPGPPVQMAADDVPIALIQESQIASDEIKAVTGIFDASMGAQGNETSGKAIMARQHQGEIATFNYSDNMGKALKLTYEILIDLIPHIYDTERELRVLGVDGTEDYVKVNQIVVDPATGQPIKVHDLAQGKYDVTVTVGPSFATQRQEATEMYTQLGNAVPVLWQAAGDLIMKSMDLPLADEISERLKVMMPPPIQQMIQGGNDMPPEVAQAMAQVDMVMQAAQEQAAIVQQQAAENEQAKAEVQKQMADLKVKEAHFKASVATEQANLKNAEADFTLRRAQAGETEGAQQVQADREALAAQHQQSVQVIQQNAVEMIQEALAAVAQILQKSQPQVINVDPPKRKRAISRRENGVIVTEIIEEQVQ